VGHRHDRDADRQQPRVASIKRTADHDDDAVYLPLSLGYVSLRKASPAPSSHVTASVPSAGWWESVFAGCRTLRPSRHPPPIASATCPTYLRTLSLRI
jgi:hypothetical protein